jgi:excisionase family DNA binding protein
MAEQIEGITFYTIRELASKLKVTPQTIRKFIKEGKLSGQRYGRPYLVSDIQLREFLLETIRKQQDAARQRQGVTTE